MFKNIDHPYFIRAPHWFNLGTQAYQPSIHRSNDRRHNGFHRNQPRLIPDWLFHSIRRKFRYPELVKREEINMFKLNMKPYQSEQIGAFFNMDNNNGILVLYEKNGNYYQPVYEKDMVVEGIKMLGILGYNQVLVVTGGAGGTGIWQTYHYVVRYTPKGYQEVWHGVHTYRLSNPLTKEYFQQNGMIDFDRGGKDLYYALLTSEPTPASLFQHYQYNHQNMKYELVKSY